MKRFLKCFILYFTLIFILEYIYKAAVFNIWISTGHIYTILFTVSYSLFFTLLTLFLPKKLSFPISLILFIVTTVIFIAEAMFTYIFDTTFSIYSLNLADQALDFISILYEALLNRWFMIVCFLMPLVIFIIMYKKFFYHMELRKFPKYAALYFGTYVIIMILISFNNHSIYSAYSLYHEIHAPSQTIAKLGLITEFKLDVSRYLFGFTPRIDVNGNGTPIENEDIEKVIEHNKLNLIFDDSDESIRHLNNYFSNRNATNKNEYTGIFKGKNIIYILAESFNSIAVDENVTPTLYKLVNSSFVFENFYSPMFMSTTGGEFQFSTSLIPTQQSLNKWKDGNVSFPYAIGNVFKNLGYETFAFHNWTYSYYKRQKTMPTLGYQNYVACGNGLEKEMNCKIWPPSDIEMMNATIDYFINKEKFAVHYITVSGHSEYNFFGNNMAMKNKKIVDELDYSTSAKAYLATHIELDKALKILMDRLEQESKLEDTVIILAGDHYPYTLDINTINELSKYERDEIFEVNRSNLIIYNPNQETTVIDKLSSQVDILPTILNMFGFDYDSRLLMGSDIMSKHESLVIFADYSWITEKGRYNATTDIFTPNKGAEVNENYVSNINKEVQNRVNVSTQIVETNYYSKILKIIN